MSKKKVKRSTPKKRQNTSQFSYVKIAFFVSLFLVVGIIGKSMMSAEHYKVLGAKTLLVRGGDDSGGDDSGGGSNSGSGSSGSSSSGSSGGGDSSNSGSSGGGSSGSGSSGSSGSGGSGGESSGAGSSVSDSTKVICTGPDGKQFETEFKDCEELNNAWNKPVVFTTLLQSATTRTKSSEVEKSSSKSELEENKVEAVVDVPKQETETELPDNERIRTRTKDGRTRIDITSGGIKTRFEMRDDRVVVKAEQEDGTEVELEDESLTKIDDRLEKDDIKVASAGADGFLLRKGAAGAVTKFPLSVDLATNELFIDTPAGQRKVTVLPKQAIEGLIAANIVSRLGEQGLSDVITNNDSGVLMSQVVKLGEKTGVPVYEIKGISDQKLLGFIPVEVEKDVTLSAETGNALSIDETFVSKILDALSF